MKRFENKYPDWTGWPQNRAVIIAEVGINHGGDESLAWEMIQIAHENGADFVKLQSFATEDFFHPSLPYFSSTKAMELSIEAQKRLFKKAKKRKIKLITTPFDFKSVDIADEFEPPAHKIASMDNDNIPLIRYIAKKGRPVLVSCGMANIREIEKVVNIMEQEGNNKLVLLHCISDYPTKPQDLNLEMINLLKSVFKMPVGLSDHSLGLKSSYIAASLGAVVIEKHFTIDRTLHDRFPDADHNISIEPYELKTLMEFCEAIPVMMGNAPRKLTKNEVSGRQNFRRGLYAKRDIKIGEYLNLENTIFLRPVSGIGAGDWDKVCGKEVKRNISQYQPILYTDLGL